MALYGLLRLKKTLVVEVIGNKVDVPLVYADGMAGCLPVFKSKEDAVKYNKGKDDGIFLLAEKE